MGPIRNRHAAGVRRLNELLSQLVAYLAIVDVQNRLVISSEYVPQPDLALLRRKPDFYASHTPTTSDCALVNEVADTSADFDMPRCAPRGVAELWLIELERDVVVVYRDPPGDGYQHVQVCHRGDTLTVSTLQCPRVAVQAILG